MKIYEENQFLNNKNVSINNFGTEGIDDPAPRKWKDIYIIIPSIIKKYLSYELKLHEELVNTGNTDNVEHSHKTNILGYSVTDGICGFNRDFIIFSCSIKMNSGRLIEFDEDEYDNDDTIIEKIENTIKSMLNKVSRVRIRVNVNYYTENGKKYIKFFNINECQIFY